jgi:hypothetical protein
MGELRDAPNDANQDCLCLIGTKVTNASMTNEKGAKPDPCQNNWRIFCHAEI